MNNQNITDMLINALKKDRLDECKRCATDGDSFLQFVLAEIYFYGINTDEEYWKNIDWAITLIKYSKKSNISSYAFVCYCNHEPDYNEALKWYKMAAQNGNKDAIEKIEEIKSGIQRPPVKTLTQFLRKGM